MIHSRLHSEEEAQKESSPGSWSREHAPNHYSIDDLCLESGFGVSQ